MGEWCMYQSGREGWRGAEGEELMREDEMRDHPSRESRMIIERSSQMMKVVLRGVSISVVAKNTVGKYHSSILAE